MQQPSEVFKTSEGSPDKTAKAVIDRLLNYINNCFVC